MEPDRGRSRASRTARRRRKRRRALVITAAVIAVLVVGTVAAVALVATGGSESTTAATTTTAPRASSTSSTSTTTIPVSTTVVPKSPDPVVALAQQYDGRYAGTFTNTTFGTSGTVVLEIRVDPATGELSTQADFDGDLFGGDAKEVRRISGTAKLGDPNAAATTQTKAFGPVTARIDENLQLVLNADDVPGGKVKGFELSGKLRDDLTGFDATYVVTFEDATTADGTVTVTCDPSGSRASEVATVCAAPATTSP
jgi:hypothetical protein